MRSVRAAIVLASALAALSAGAACSTFTGEPALDADAGVSEGGTGGARPMGTSCKAILAAHPEVAGRDGIYPLSRDGGAENVYCDMTANDGGWTLVGRSAPGAKSKQFGWHKRTGDVTKPEYPYSLDVIGIGLDFTEVLVAEGSTSGGVGDVAFRFEAKPGFLQAVTTTIETRPVLYVRGPCKPAAGAPSMMKYAGATGLEDVFFLRDLAATDIRNGLKADGWDLTTGDCSKNGTLDGKQGVILVR